MCPARNGLSDSVARCSRPWRTPVRKSSRPSLLSIFLKPRQHLVQHRRVSLPLRHLCHHLPSNLCHHPLWLLIMIRPFHLGLHFRLRPSHQASRPHLSLLTESKDPEIFQMRTGKGKTTRNREAAESRGK